MTTSNIGTNSNTNVGARTATTLNLKTLKTPAEGGTKKEYEDFLDTIQTHVSINWDFGQDIAYVIKNNAIPTFDEPQDLSASEEKQKWKVRLWNQKVDRYGQQISMLEDNMGALFSLLSDSVSKIMRAKVKSKQGYTNAEKRKDAVWLLKAMEDIILNFEETKPKLLAIDDQMETIMKLKQGNTTNEDFIKTVSKELKVYEKHGGDFLWGKTQEQAMALRMKIATAEHEKSKGSPLDNDETQEIKSNVKKALKEQILAMTILKRADKRRYGNLQIGLKNDYLLGKNDYPVTISDLLKVMNNYTPEWTPPSANDNTSSTPTNATPNAESSNGTPSVSFLQANGTLQVRYLRGTNNSFFRKITCSICKMKGHYPSHCPVVNSSGNPMGSGPGTNGNSANTSTDTTTGSSNQDDPAPDNTPNQEVSNFVCHSRILLNQNIDAHLNPNWVLLDSESTDHIFCNRDLLTDVKPTTDGEFLKLHTSAGTIDTHQRGLFGSFNVWYNPDCIANVLSLAQVTDQFRVTMDTAIKNSLNVHISENHMIEFKRVIPGLYLFDTSDVDIYKLKEAFSFLNTVSQNKSYFKKRDVRKADDAIILNRKTNHISKDKFIRIVRDNWIRNNPVTVGDVNRSHAIYGPPIPPLKGRTRYQESTRVSDITPISIPKELYNDLKNVTLCIDFHFVNGVTVFHTISRRINYRTVSFPLSRSKPIIVEELKKVYQKYNSRGFRITDIHADVEFEKIRNDILPVRLHTCGVDDHVPEIERSVQTQKNENRSVCYAMPYKCFPRVMVRELVSQGNTFLNAFGNDDSIADGLSPRNIIDNLPHIDYNDLKYEFGQYVQLHVTDPKTNTMASRTIGAIVLGPKLIQGQYTFMSLESGNIIDGRVVAVLPITNEVVQRVETLGSKQSQPYRASKMLQYEWRPGRTIDADEATLAIDEVTPTYDHIPEPVQQDMQPAGPNPLQIVDAIPTVTPDTATHQGAEDYHINDENQDNVQQDQEIPEEQELTENQGAQDVTIHGDQGAAQITHTEGNNNQVIVEDVTDDEEEDVDSEDDEIEQRRNIEKQRRSEHFKMPDSENYGRGKRERKQTINFSFLQTKFDDLTKEDKSDFLSEAWKEYKLSGKTNLLERYTTGFVFAQLSAKKGIERYGREAELKLIDEFKQLMEYKTFHGRDASTLTYEQRRGAANMINLIEEKTNRGHTPENPVIKGRSVFNGRVQRGLYTKEETASPTVSQDSFFLTSIIDAMEGRDTAITDVKGAYLHAKMKDEVFMKIVGKEVDLFCEIDPSLKKFITYIKGIKTIYVQLDRALYGCVQSALLWYELYSTTLKDLGFVLNPYDLCVANSIIEGKQCTIVWYVDDNKISHVNPKVIDRIIKQIESKFGKMSKTRGNCHEFLGMNILFKNNKVKIDMKKHVLKAINDFDEDITRNAATPARSCLFHIRESKKLSEKRADNFHSVTASLLFISRRCRLDIQTAVGFLTTRVSCPTEDDWVKLRRVLQYLRGTIDLTLTLGADDIRKMKSWVDVSYGVHADCKSHTGGAMSWGWGVLLTKCQKQKLNTKSSTEGEIVGVSDFMPNMIWARMFLEAQGFLVDENTLYQDNQSAIKIENNGKSSGGQKTKHMDIRYFFIKDRLKSEGIKVEYCPTGMMIADFFTKPLQGNLFRKFRDIVLGYKHVTEIVDESSKCELSTNQERVGCNLLTVKNKNVKNSIGCESAKLMNDLPTEHENNKKTVTWSDIVKGKNNSKNRMSTNDNGLILLK
jgi:hypothetical protein